MRPGSVVALASAVSVAVAIAPTTAAALVCGSTGADGPPNSPLGDSPAAWGYDLRRTPSLVAVNAAPWGLFWCDSINFDADFDCALEAEGERVELSLDAGSDGELTDRDCWGYAPYFHGTQGLPNMALVRLVPEHALTPDTEYAITCESSPIEFGPGVRTRVSAEPSLPLSGFGYEAVIDDHEECCTAYEAAFLKFPDVPGGFFGGGGLLEVTPGAAAGRGTVKSVPWIVLLDGDGGDEGHVFFPDYSEFTVTAIAGDGTRGEPVVIRDIENIASGGGGFGCSQGRRVPLLAWILAPIVLLRLRRRRPATTV